MDHPPLIDDDARRRLRWFAHFMDNSVRIPGTRWRIGIDPVIGLVPGVGDAVCLIVSVYPILEARRAGVKGPVLRKMAGNILLDAFVGSVPILGDIFDAGFKANIRNLRLLGIEPIDPLRKSAADRAGR